MSASSNPPTGDAESQGEEIPFAPTPVWARTTTRKRRGFGGARPAARTTPAADLASDLTAESARASSPTYVRRPVLRPARNNITAAALVAGVTAVAVIGGVAWYANRPHDEGMVQLTPGVPSEAPSFETQVAVSGPTPSAAQAPMAPAADLPRARAERLATAPTTVRRTTTTTTRRAAARTRPASSDSAADTAVNASATAPMVVPPAPPPSVDPTVPQSTTVNPAPLDAPADTTTAAPPVTTTP
jgi:hypothetical protein